jgi:hypothetical protein
VAYCAKLINLAKIPDFFSLPEYKMDNTAYIQADHANMCKFTGADDPSYQAVQSAIASIMRDIEKVSDIEEVK